MKFTTITIAIMATLFASAEACKCLSNIGNNKEATSACCREAGGSPIGGGTDCPAGQISNRMSTFAYCCRSYGTRSDCRCPLGCARKELEAANTADGKEAPTEDEVQALFDSYEG